MSIIPTASRPTVKELDPALKGLVRWKNFAIQLPAIELSDVVEIEQNYRGNIADQRLAVYGTWLGKCVSASWLNVITALETIDENVLAEHLKVKYGVVTHHSSISLDDAIPQTQLLPNSSSDTYQDILVPSEVKVVKDLEWLNDSFCNLLVDLRMEIDRLVESDKTVLRKIAYRIDAEECYTIKGLAAVKEPIELFDLLRPHYNFLDIDPLEIIAEYLKHVIFCARMQEHNDSVKIFKSYTPVQSLRDSIIPYVPLPNSSNPRIIVIIKLQKPWKKRSIKLVERLTESLFPGNSHAFEWFRVMHGSVYIMFLVPKEKTRSLVAISHHKFQFMKLMGVISLQIGSTRVLNEDENKSFSFDSALLEASQLGNNEAIQFLVDLGADDNITSNTVVPQARHEEKLVSIFMGAIKQNNLRVVAELMNKVSIINIQLGVTVACRLGYSTIISQLIEHLHISSQVFIASLNENTTSLKQQLTQSGINPNTTLISNITPLMIASSCGHIEVLECLLQAEADVNSKDEDGYTPLAYAITGSKSLTIVQRLLQSGANPNILVGGISIIEKVKKENGTEEIVNLLLKYSALHLYKDYEQLPEKVKKCINDQIEEKKLTIFQVAEKIETHFEVTGLTKAQNAHKLFNKLQPYYSFLSCDILVDITREFIGGEIENELEGYLVMMRKFQKSVKIKQLKEAMSLVPIQHDTSDTCDVNIKLNGEWEEGSLENLQQLLKHMFHNKRHLLNHMTVDERESLCITFTIPTSQSDGTADEVKESKQFIECVGVSRVSVGDFDVSIMEDFKFSFSSGLLRAAGNGINKAVQFFLEMGVSIDDVDSNGRTALMLASKAGHNKLVEMIFSAGANGSCQDHEQTAVGTDTVSLPHTDIDQDSTILMAAKKDQTAITVTLVTRYNGDLDKQDNNGLTALCHASHSGHSNVVQILLEGGADPNIQEEYGWTALMYASHNGYFEVVQMLLEGGADPNIQKKNGWTALMYSSENSHPEVVKILLKRGAHPNIHDEYGWTALMYASHNGHSELVQILLKGGADPNIQEENRWTALMYASHNGHSEVVQILLKGGADPNIQEENRWTALMYACRNDHSEVVQILLKGGADPNTQKKDGSTAMMYACRNDHSEVVQILLKGGADPNIQKEDGWSAMIYACQNGHSKVVEILLKGGADPNIQKGDGWTALMSASQNGHSEVVEILLKGGADPNTQKKDGSTALMYACQNDHSEVVQILLEGGADPNIQDEYGWTALMYTSDNGYSEMLQILLDGGADPNIQKEDGQSALMSASKKGHFEVVQILLEGGADPNNQKKDGSTALMYASHEGHSKVVKILLKGGANPNIQRKDGWTAMMCSIENSHYEVVKILLKGGANPNIQEEYGWTALMYASHNGHLYLVRKLLKGGADPNFQNKSGKTALMYGSEKGYSNVVEVLLNGGANPKMKTKRGNKALAFAITNNHLRVIELLKTHK